MNVNNPLNTDDASESGDFIFDNLKQEDDGTSDSQVGRRTNVSDLEDEEYDDSDRVNLDQGPDYDDDENYNQEYEEDEDDPYANLDPAMRATMQNLGNSLILPEMELDVTDPEDFEQIMDFHNENLIDGYIENVSANLSERDAMILDALVSGVSLEDVDFSPDEVDYSRVDETDPENQRNLVLDYLINVLDMEEEDAEEQVDTFTETVLAKQASIAKAQLTAAQIEEVRQAREQAERNMELEQLQEQRRLEQFKAQIFSIDSVAGTRLSNSDKNEIYEYYTVPVKGGKTRAELDANTIDNVALVAFMNINNISFNKIERMAETKAVNKFLRVGDSEQNRGTTRPARNTRIATDENTNFVVGF